MSGRLELRYQRLLWAYPRAYRNQRDEVSVLPDLFTQAQALRTLGDRPLAVLTASATSTSPLTSTTAFRGELRASAKRLTLSPFGTATAAPA